MGFDASESARDFIDLLDVLAPRESDLVTVIYAAFDESYGPSGLLCVAGHVYTKKGARKLAGEWGSMLQKYRLPYFRMSACAHGNYPFNRLSAAKRDEVARRAIALIRKNASVYVATTVNELEFNEKVPTGAQIGHVRAYEFCVWNSLFAVRASKREYKLSGRVAFLFESGHRSRKAANRLMHELIEIPSIREDYSYLSHMFIDKEDSALVQAADLLAWQSFQDRQRQLSGRPRRKDMEELVKMNGVVRHIDVDRHAETVARTTKEIEEIKAAQASSVSEQAGQ